MSQSNLITRDSDNHTTERGVPVTRIRIDDLPIAEELTPEQEALIQGAGLKSFRPSLEVLERREVPAFIGAANITYTDNVLRIANTSHQGGFATVQFNDAGQLQVSRMGNIHNTGLTRPEFREIAFSGAQGKDVFTNYTGIKSTFANQEQQDVHKQFELRSTPFEDSSANFGAREMVVTADGQAQPIGRFIGQNQRPTVTWQNAPPGTLSFAAVMRDLDAPDGPFSHWVVYNIPADARGLSNLALPGNTLQGLNDSGTSGYLGPNPRLGPRTHNYEITLYALRTRS